MDGFLYVAVVLDAWGRRVVSWAMAQAHLRPSWSLDTLNMAFWQRRAHGVIHHSDQVSQYTLDHVRARCKEAGQRPSAGSFGGTRTYGWCGRDGGVTRLLPDLTSHTAM